MTMSTPTSTTTTPPHRSAAPPLDPVGHGVLHLLALWPYLISGVAAPGWAVLSLLVLWALLGVVAVAVHRRWGALAALVPLAAVGLWFLALTLGEQLLGWTG
jgi:hypothetical protein